MIGIESANGNKTGVPMSDAELTIRETLERMKKTDSNTTIGMPVDRIRRTAAVHPKWRPGPHHN